MTLPLLTRDMLQIGPYKDSLAIAQLKGLVETQIWKIAPTKLFKVFTFIKCIRRHAFPVTAISLNALGWSQKPEYAGL